MAVITTAQAGNSSSAATWTGGVIPNNGDTVIANHALTIDQNIIVGHSPGEADAVQAILVTGAGASLTIATGATLRVRGDVVLANNPITLQQGSSLIFDSSQAAAPLTTSYFLKVGLNNPSTSTTFTANGTAGSRVTITSDPSGANGYITKGLYYVGSVLATYTDFSRLGNSAHTKAIEILPNTDGKTWVFADCTFKQFGGKIQVGRGCGAGMIAFRRNLFDKNRYYPIITFDAYPAAAAREVVGNWFDRQVEWQSSAGLHSYVVDDNTFISSLSAADYTGGVIASFKNNTFLDEAGKTFAYTFRNNSGTIQDSLVIWNNINGAHYDSTFYALGEINYDGGVVENTFNQSEAPDLHALHGSVGTPTNTSIKNYLYAKNAAGGSPGFLAHLKGNKHSRFSFENNTAPITFAAPQTGLYTGSGCAIYPGNLVSLKNNLFFTGSPVAGNDYGFKAMDYLNAGTTGSRWTGTGQAGGSTTVLVLSGNVLPTAAVYTIEGYQLKIGAEVRTVTANTSNSVTVGVAFSATTVGQAFELFGIDQITTASNNAWAGFLADGTIYNASNAVHTSAKVGYSGFAQTVPDNVGVNDVVLSSVPFVDTSRSIATFATAGLGNTANTAWGDATVYAEGAGVSKAVAGFYGNTTLNYRARIAHTSSARVSPGGFTSFSIVASTVANTVNALATTATPHGFAVGDRVKISYAPIHTSWTILSVPSDTTFTIDNQIALGAGTNATIYQDWRDYWEFEGLYEMRKAQSQEFGYNSAATQAEVLAWIKGGYAPTNATLLTAGEGGTYIGAVMPYIAPSANRQSNTFGFSLGFGW